MGHPPEPSPSCSGMAGMAAHHTNDDEHQEQHGAGLHCNAAVANLACIPKRGTKRRFSLQVAADMTPPTPRDFGSHRDQDSGLGDRWSNEIDTHGGSNRFQFFQSDLGPAGRASVPAMTNLPAEDETAFWHGEAEPRMKHSRTDSYEQPEPDQPRRQTRRSLAGNGPEAAKKFACPFYMRNPLEHYECLRYVLRRIKDVKQHLNRKHKQPDFYCPRCFAVFETGGRRDAHVRDVICKRLPSPPHEGMTQDQKNELSKYDSRGKDPVSQWSDIWNVLFPAVEQDHSKSIYVGSLLEESTALFRSCWENNRTEILAEISLARPLTPPSTPPSPRHINSVMVGIFNHIKAAAARESGVRAECFVATDDGHNFVDHWHPPTRPSTVGAAEGNRSSAGGPPPLATPERAPSVVSWDSAMDAALDPEFLLQSGLQHPPEELGELPLLSASDYPLDPLTQSYPDAILPFH